MDAVPVMMDSAGIAPATFRLQSGWRNSEAELSESYKYRLVIK